MAKNRKPIQSPEAKARQLQRIEAKEQAEKLAAIKEKFYKRGLMAAARLQAKQSGFAAGLKAEQKKRR